MMRPAAEERLRDDAGTLVAKHTIIDKWYYLFNEGGSLVEPHRRPGQLVNR